MRTDLSRLGPALAIAAIPLALPMVVQVVLSRGAITESKEVLGGYWLIQANSRKEAIEWAKRVPAAEGDVVEVRQVVETEDWPEDVRKAADSPVVKSALAKHR